MDEDTPLEYSLEWLNSKSWDQPLSTIILFPEELHYIMMKMKEKQSELFKELAYRYLPDMMLFLEGKGIPISISIQFQQTVGYLKLERTLI